MLYARVDDKFHWPMAWEECQYMNKHLNRMTFGYQLVLEKKMLAAQFGEECRGVLVKWGDNRITRDKKREVLLETTDPEQMKAALFMLINEADAVV